MQAFTHTCDKTDVKYSKALLFFPPKLPWPYAIPCIAKLCLIYLLAIPSDKDLANKRYDIPLYYGLSSKSIVEPWVHGHEPCSWQKQKKASLKVYVQTAHLLILLSLTPIKYFSFSQMIWERKKSCFFSVDKLTVDKLKGAASLLTLLSIWRVVLAKTSCLFLSLVSSWFCWVQVANCSYLLPYKTWAFCWRFISCLVFISVAKVN